MIFPVVIGKLAAGITALVLANILAPKLLAKVQNSVKESSIGGLYEYQ